MRIIAIIEKRRKAWKEASGRYYRKHKEEIRRNLSEKRTDSLVRQRVNEKAKKYRQAYPDRCRAANKKWRENNREKHLHKIRSSHLRKDYGISVEQYDTLFKSQNGVCALCGNPPGRRRLAVDHCHNSKKVRGLLCHHCNAGIGNLRDDISLLSAAIKYLTKEDSPCAQLQ